MMVVGVEVWKCGGVEVLVAEMLLANIHTYVHIYRTQTR